MNRIIFAFIFWLSPMHLMPQTYSLYPSTQYLYPEFSQSVVKLKNGKTEKILMNYNTVTGLMVYEKDNKLLDLISTEIVDTIFMQNVKFIPVGQIFQEVVLIAPISLFIQYKGKIVHAGNPAAYGGTSQTSSSHTYSGINTNTGYFNLKLPPDITVKIEPIYWIRKDNDMFSFKTKKEFLKIFSDKAVKIKQFIKQNHIKFYNQDQLIELINYCNNFIS